MYFTVFLNKDDDDDDDDEINYLLTWNDFCFVVFCFLHIMGPGGGGGGGGQYSGIAIARTLGFSNLPKTRAKSRFPSSVEHCNFTPDFSNSPIFRTNFRLPWRFVKSVFHCMDNIIRKNYTRSSVHRRVV